jgi:hypothetical protein
LFRAARIAQLPAALSLGLAFLLPPGIPAVILATPWIAVTGLLAAVGLLRIRRRTFRPLSDLCIGAALVFASIGSLWASFDRAGFRPLDFDSVIVLLTAVHFHYAGFVLCTMAGLALRRVRGGLASLAGIGVIVGVPCVAAGITSTQLGARPLWECLAAWLLSASGILAAFLYLFLATQRGQPRIARILWAISAISLFASMILAATYGARSFAPIAWLTIPWMRALHGSANALGFALAALLGWTIAERRWETTRR